ncbi:MAG TPA: four helix bundle protein [Anaerolineales bacterium]|nr:four helix bundle protein [Anaerolineales bacterium]
MNIRNYRDLMIWQKAMDLAQEVYRFARALPRNEIYGLGGQMQRAAVSVPSNIAEGQARRHTAEFRQFLFQALGSLAELDTQLLLCGRLGYLGTAETTAGEARVAELQRMIHGLIVHLPKARRRTPSLPPIANH